ncbi:MAG: lamin tail domain-containing protein, partial [FCB group bacterium]|nr:lamin tail domain-containing protein [FCB group bacterium]
SVDGALQSVVLNYNNSIPDSITEISALVSLSNPGLTSISGNIQISEDAVILASEPVPFLAPGDSVTREVSLGTFSPGLHQLLANWSITGDGDTLNNHYSVLLKIRYPESVIQFNEFFPLPNNDQTEFVELVSLGTLPFTGWSLMDSRKIPVMLSEKILRPFDLVTIAGDSSILNRLPEPELGIILAGTFPTLNNSGDALYLLDLTGSVIDSLRYTPDWPLAEEHSLEKVSPAFPSADPSSWKTCTAVEGQTPGRPNSVLLAARDGELLPDFYWSPRFPEPEEAVRCSVRVTNQGLEPITGSISVELADEEIAEISVPELSRLDTVPVFPVFSLPGEGPQPLTISFHISGDGNPWNNMTTDTIWVRYSPGCAVLNEFLAIPDSGVAEFVEVILQREIAPGPWRISDGSSEAILPQFGGSRGVYIVLGADSSWAGLNFVRTVIPGSWPSLNNSGDRILLMDPTGKKIDSLEFTTDWALIPGRSQEKFRPDYPSADFRSWGVSVDEDGMTPGKPNSILVDTLNAKAVIRYEPDPFSPDGDGRDDRLWIHYRLPYNQSVFTVEVFDASGRQIATPVSRQVVSREGVLYWDGHRGNGDKARIGLYLVKAEAEDLQSSKRWENLQTVVLAGRLSK